MAAAQVLGDDARLDRLGPRLSLHDNAKQQLLLHLDKDPAKIPFLLKYFKTPPPGSYCRPRYQFPAWGGGFPAPI